ncbi:RmlC-like cupin domain-containing protein [Pisolithus marmoratus]|nr:RmlC-like cupin domain-containing protein [Pisolithus marmoratus]
MSLPTTASRSVIKKVLAIETAEGVGARVRRSIGSMNLRNLTPFLMLDHFHVSKGAGFPDHPHRGQATVTYMLEGSSRHEDSAGHAGTIETGGVQWMVRALSTPRCLFMHLAFRNQEVLQLWVDLPKQYKMVEPSYQELGPDAIPTAYPSGHDGPIKVKVISGKSHGIESPVRPLGGCWFLHVMMEESGATFFQDIRMSSSATLLKCSTRTATALGWTAFIYIWKGVIRIGNDIDGPVHDNFHTLVLSNNGEPGVQLTATENDTQFVLHPLPVKIAGEPLDQTVFQYGPFVMTNREEVQQTLLDYQFGRNGFEKAHTWKSKIGN